MKCQMSILALLLVMIPISGCAPAEEQPEPAVEETASTEADIEAINQVREQEVAAATAADIDGFLAIWTDDVAIMPPNEPAVTGQQAGRLWLDDFFKELTMSELTYTSSDVVVVGDWAIEQYSFAWTLTPVDGGEPIPDNGKGFHIYQRQPDGSWKIARDIWNSDNPPPGAP